MTETHTTIDGHRVTALRVIVGNVGPWHAEVTCEDDAKGLTVGALVTLKAGALTLRGTLVSAGTFGLQLRGRVVGGAGGWGRPLTAQHYHNDAGVKARAVADDAARSVGETIGVFVPAAERIGPDYVRQIRSASGALEDVLGGVAWWVDYEGLTNAGPRAAVAVDASKYEVLAFDPKERIVTLGVDDPGAVQIGSILSERLDGPQTVRELELRITPEEMRVMAWCGGGDPLPGRLAGLVRTVVERVTDGRLWGRYRYRVLRMAGARVELQAVHRAEGLPDIIPVSLWPGVPGIHAELAPSAEVLVEFLDGRRNEPIVTGFVGPGGPGFAPVRLTLGGETGSGVARIGDTVDVLLPPAVFNGTIVIGGTPSPASGVFTFTMGKTLGTISTGSHIVGAAP